METKGVVGCSKRGATKPPLLSESQGSCIHTSSIDNAILFGLSLTLVLFVSRRQFSTSVATKI